MAQGMEITMKAVSLITKIAFAASLTFTVSTAFDMQQASAAQLKYVVNNVPITSYDIQNRQALLRLFRQKTDAGKDMIDHVLKSSEMQRLRINVSKVFSSKRPAAASEMPFGLLTPTRPT